MTDFVEPLAYFDGRFLPATAAVVPVTDMGLVHGAAVTEMVRTFRHQPFRLDAHLDRLIRSAAAVFIPVSASRKELLAAVERVVEHNVALIGAEDDLGIVIFATAGPNPTYLGRSAAHGTGTVCVHTFRLPFELWADRCRHGQHLVVPSICAIPPECLDPHVKSRSRLPWYVADRQARQSRPDASALLVDSAGRITETSTANFYIVSDGRILTPPESLVLPGVSREVVRQLADGLGLPFEFTELRLAHIEQADEAFTSSTPYCLMPVQTLDGQPVGRSCPGPVYHRLLAAWSESVGMDIEAQIHSSTA